MSVQCLGLLLRKEACKPLLVSPLFHWRAVQWVLCSPLNAAASCQGSRGRK